MNIGPRFALWALAPAEWNQRGWLSDSQVALQTETREGFLVEIFAKSFREKLLATGSYQWIFTAEIIREDANIYYAFETGLDRSLFIELRELDSVGPKTAALAVGGLGRQKLLELMRGSLTSKDVKVTGLGPKTLDKIVSGLKEKEERFLPLLLTGPSGPDTAGTTAYVSGSAVTSQLPAVILQSMERLGLRTQDTLRLYQELLAEDGHIESRDPATLVKLLLQRWGQNKSRMNFGPTTETR